MIKKRYGIKIVSIYFLIFVSTPFITTLNAQTAGYPWRNHSAPYNFIFNNHIDTHQQTQVKSNGELFGYLYVSRTGQILNGIPVAEHRDCNDPSNACEVGWIIRGKPLDGEASSPIFVYHVNGDHPVWLVQSRNDIPQPGSFSHFHWLNGPNDAVGLNPEDPYPGYILELQAVSRFYFFHHSENILVIPGIDISTHVNIVASYP